MTIGIGIDVGGTKVLGCAVDETGALVAETRLGSTRTREALVGVLVTCAETLVSALGARSRLVTGVGVGLPGLVDRSGVLHETANLHGAEGLALPKTLTGPLEKLFGPCTAVPGWRLVVDNDATCAAAGEHTFGAGRGALDSITVTLGTGIGGGIVSSGRIVHGERSFSGEIGHMVVDPSGPPCGCGRRGCWEVFASGTGLARLARQAAAEGRAARLWEMVGGELDEIRAEHVVQAGAEGDPGAVSVIGEYGEYLALGLANLAEILDPGRIILAGGLVAAGSVLLGPAMTAYRSGFRRGEGPRAVPVVVAELGERAGAYGAAALALGAVG